MSDKDTTTIAPTDVMNQFRPKPVGKNLVTVSADQPATETKETVSVKDESTSSTTSVPTKPINRVLKDTVQRRTPLERAVDTVIQQLQIYKNEPYGSTVRIQALARVVDAVAKSPKKNVLDEILAFFKANRNEEFLDEMHALQAIAQLNPGIRVKVQIMYYLMYSLANNTASKSTISLDVIQNVFKSDEIVAWVSVHLKGTRGAVRRSR